MPEEVIKRVEAMSTNKNERWLDEDSAEAKEDGTNNEFNEAEDGAEDIGATPFNDMNIVAEVVEPVDNEFEPACLDAPVNEDLDDRNELEDDQMIEQMPR